MVATDRQHDRVFSRTIRSFYVASGDLGHVTGCYNIRDEAERPHKGTVGQPSPSPFRRRSDSGVKDFEQVPFWSRGRYADNDA